jgi:hypothetical protein
LHISLASWKLIEVDVQMDKSAKLGVICLVIGFSFVVGTFYRSISTNSFGYKNFVPLEAHSWSTNKETAITMQYFWAPQDLRVEVKTNATIDMYILDAEGMRAWESDGVLKPTWSSNNITQLIFELQVPIRAEYTFLIYNPTDLPAEYEIYFTLYGYERDFLWISITFILAGFILILASILVSRRLDRKKVCLHSKQVT